MKYLCNLMMEMDLDTREEGIVEDFSMLGDWMDKYEYIIDLGKELDPMDEKHRTEDNLIRGCQSQVWLTSEFIEGRVHFTADSDALITRGLVALMIRALSGLKANEIINAQLEFVKEIGLHEHLSPNRSNGLVSMIKQMKMYALAFSEK